MDKRYLLALQLALFFGFVLAGAFSLHESWMTCLMIQREMFLDAFFPNLGNALLPDEHMHTIREYWYALSALFCALALLLTRRQQSKAAALEVAPAALIP